MPMKTAAVTYIAARGTPGHENLYPATQCIKYETDGIFGYFIADIRERGFWLGEENTPQRRWISPTAILSIKLDYKHEK